MAYTGPSPASFLRLAAHHWNCGFASFRIENREAANRICPSPATDPERAARSFNLDHRPAVPPLGIAPLPPASARPWVSWRPMPAPGSWLPELMRSCYTSLKRLELELADAQSPEEPRRRHTAAT